ncbi:MAG: hypothetical protein A2161_14265 [Candidatus Schekmanbacteria bacterium RBG_13_48_7]|uniref:Uncharacterized protein n=1 Tax=Candidatus Schekmanbacteria bacterium RBG_13_48_7 TaxID=1817878 RepID=A0A1F7S0D6_9BACT|nr:MAG: hypothetical protein A2161_14265 [Candidatus Schekmanbacteria bacterium RBG_13_48_7]
MDEDDFVVLWSGGYNTWTDVDSLYNGLVMAMEENPRIKFVSIGGAIDGHDTMTYERFKNLVEASPYNKNFILLGWVPHEEVHNYYLEANTGLILDAPMYEGLLGCKTRVLEWVRAGLPSMATELCELTTILNKKDLGYTFPIGSPAAIKKLLIYLAEHPKELAETGLRAKKYGFDNFVFEKTTQPLREWTQNPTIAPDSQRKIQLFEDDSLRLHIEYHKLRQYALSLQEEIGQIREENKQLRSRIPFNPFSHDGPLVSIIVVYYKGDKYLENCLKSIEDNSYRNYEIVVVNNDIGDHFVEETAKKFSRVKVVSAGKNIGFSKGNNLAIKYVAGEIIVFLNQDTEVFPDWLTEIVKVMQSEKKIGIVGSKIFNSHGKILQHAGGHIFGNALTNHVGYGEVDNGNFDEISEMEYVTGASLAISMETLKFVKGFDPIYFPGYFEDADLCLTARAHGFKVVYAPSSTLHHHESTSLSKFSEKFFYYFHRSRLRFVIKNYTISDVFNKFLPVEYVWLRDFVGPDQINPLRRAYFDLFLSFPRLLLHRLRSRKLSSDLIRFGHPQVSTDSLKLRGLPLLIKTFQLLWSHPRRPGLSKPVNKHES